MSANSARMDERTNGQTNGCLEGQPIKKHTNKNNEPKPPQRKHVSANKRGTRSTDPGQRKFTLMIVKKVYDTRTLGGRTAVLWTTASFGAVDEFHLMTA